MKYVIIGSALEGNKGAASMLEAAMQTITKADKAAEVTLLSMYPTADAKLNTYKNLRILPAKPLFLGLALNPLGLLYWVLPPLRPLLRRQRHVRAIAEADAYLDQGGITFVDGREVFLLYNIASIWPALFMKTPVIKCAQAMGPFKSRLNRWAAKIFLPRMELICARGEKTHQSLQKLQLDNVSLVADYAFLLEITTPERRKAEKLLAARGYDKSHLNIGVFPSEVLRKKMAKKGGDYEGVVAGLIDQITTKHQKATVYLLPHSQRATDKRHNNDVPVCDAIYERVSDQARCTYIKQPTSPQQLRTIIESMDVAVVARFHAMVSALAVKTPVLVTGWSHKYQEVLDMFELQDAAFDVSDISADMVYTHLQSTIKNKKTMERTIARHLPAVRRSAQAQVIAIIKTAQKK